MSWSWASSGIKKDGAGRQPVHSIYMMAHFSDYRASPRLKDAKIDDPSVYSSLYAELVLNIRKLFHQCKLVHADLSEYNILYHEGHLYIIDVSQSVEHDHPSAFDFLRSDIKNVEDYFSKMGVKCLGLRRCFEFIVKEKLGASDGLNDDDLFRKWLELAVSDDPSEGGAKTSGRSAHEDAIFKGSYIPRTLGELYDPEREVAALSLDDWQKPIYADTIELVQPEKKDVTQEVDTQPDVKALLVPLSEGDSQDSSTSYVSSEAEGQDTRPFDDKRPPRGHRHEDRELKKVHFSTVSTYTLSSDTRAQERKKATKAEQRERRKSKMPKAEKKKRIKASH